MHKLPGTTVGLGRMGLFSCMNSLTLQDRATAGTRCSYKATTNRGKISSGFMTKININTYIFR